jgi:Na+/melibiose symporter-like transporter
MPFLLIGAPLAAVALLLLPLGGTLVAVVPALLAFYVGYFIYYPPYRAEYPDLVPAQLRGRSQSAQKTLREVGLVLALVGGGVLLSVGREVPFAVAAVLLILATIGFFVGVPSASRQGGKRSGSDEGAYSAARAVLAKRPVRLLLTANLLWELALGAIKTFVVLFFVVGMGRSTGFASAVLAGAAVAIVGGALVGGALGDRIGEMRLLRAGAAVYGVGLLAPLISQSPVVLAIVAPTAFAGGVVMTLSFAAVMRTMPPGRHGSLAGVFELTRGVGTMLGPILAGAAIEASKGALSSTHGYAAMWAVASMAVLLSIPVLGRAKAAVAGGRS